MKLITDLQTLFPTDIPITRNGEWIGITSTGRAAGRLIHANRAELPAALRAELRRCLNTDSAVLSAVAEWLNDEAGLPIWDQPVGSLIAAITAITTPPPTMPASPHHSTAGTTKPAEWCTERSLVAYADLLDVIYPLSHGPADFESLEKLALYLLEKKGLSIYGVGGVGNLIAAVTPPPAPAAAPAPAQAAPANSSNGKPRRDREVAMAVALLVKTPGMSARQLAKAVGCSHTTLVRSGLFNRAKVLARNGKAYRPAGTKDKNGKLEAVDTDDWTDLQD